LIITFALLLWPSTAPTEIACFASNQFKMSYLWALMVLAFFFIGSSFERMTWVHH